MIARPQLLMETHKLSFRGERLVLVREYLGLTQKQMSERLGVTNVMLSDFENGKRQPSDLVRSRLEFETGFLSHFFVTPMHGHFRETECSFRHRRATPQRIKDQVRAHASLLNTVVEGLRHHYLFPAVRLPSFPTNDVAGPEYAAAYSRHVWGLEPNIPIKQVGRALELAGIVVLSGSVATTQVDAFSKSTGNPLVFLNKGAGTWPSRWHFDLAHELGHLVMHQGLQTGSVVSEAEADSFASAFLMPRDGFIRDFSSKPFSWSFVFELKQRWYVSAAAIIRRARDLDLMDDTGYRRAFQYMSAKRWRVRGEPHEPKFQEPELFNDALADLLSDRNEFEDFHKQLGFSAALFARVADLQLRPAGPVQLLSFPKLAEV